MTCWFEEGEERRGRESRFSFRSVPPAFALLSSLPFLLLLSYSQLTGLVTPHARPRAALDGTNTYGTFLSSASSGRCSRISIGSVSAAITTNSEMPRLSVLVAVYFWSIFIVFCGGRDRSIGREREPVSHMLLSIGLGVEARANSEWDLLNFRGGGSGG